MRYLVLTLSLLFATAHSAAAQEPSPEFRAHVEQLLKVMGMVDAGKQFVSSMSTMMVDNMRAQMPDLPPRAAAVISEVFTEEFAKMFEGPESAIPDFTRIYARYFTDADMTALLAFYSTDLGQKVAKSLPAITRDSAEVGQKWATERLPQIMTHMQEQLRAEKLIP